VCLESSTSGDVSRARGSPPLKLDLIFRLAVPSPGAVVVGRNLGRNLGRASSRSTAWTLWSARAEPCAAYSDVSACRPRHATCWLGGHSSWEFVPLIAFEYSHANYFIHSDLPPRPSRALSLSSGAF
jgi:hypothetical protein